MIEDTEVNPPPQAELLHQAARRLALSGCPVFPCYNTPENKVAHKKPHTKNGYKDATCNVETVVKWWNRWPSALIGMPTGKGIGATVVDVDLGKIGHHNPKLHAEGLAAQEWWNANKAAYQTSTIVRTQSGGLHVYCKFNGERNTQGGIHKGVDRRGEGGYVIVPPSPGYEVIQTSPSDKWPEAPTNADGSTGGGVELGLHKYRDGRTVEDLHTLADVLIKLMIQPDELHKHFQKIAFIAANWWKFETNSIEDFMRAALIAAYQGGTITTELYEKHRVRLPAIARWYYTKAREDIDPIIEAGVARSEARTVAEFITAATEDELQQIEQLIQKRRGSG